MQAITECRRHLTPVTVWTVGLLAVAEWLLLPLMRTRQPSYLSPFSKFRLRHKAFIKCESRQLLIARSHVVKLQLQVVFLSDTRLLEQKRGPDIFFYFSGKIQVFPHTKT